MAADYCADSAPDNFHFRLPESQRAGKCFCKPRCQQRQSSQLGALLVAQIVRKKLCFFFHSMEPGMSFFTSGKEGRHVNDVVIVLKDVLQSVTEWRFGYFLKRQRQKHITPNCCLVSFLLSCLIGDCLCLTIMSEFLQVVSALDSQLTLLHGLDDPTNLASALAYGRRYRAVTSSFPST